MARHSHNLDPRTVKATDLLLEDPTMTVPQAMRMSGFSVEDSRDRTKQMRVRRRMPTKKSMMMAGQLQSVAAPATKAVPSLQNSVAPGCFNGDAAAEIHFQCGLQAWINFNRVNIINIEEQDTFSPTTTTSSMQRKYLEQAVQILHSLCEKIVCESSRNILDCGQNRKAVVHPDFIAVNNIAVYNFSARLDIGDCKQMMSAYFIRGGSDSPFLHTQVNEYETRNKYAVMNAFAKIAYAMCMMGNGPNLPDVPARHVTSSDMDLSIALSLKDERGATDINDEEDEILEMMRKSYRGSEYKDNNDGGFISAMTDAGIPLPMRRFISDLTGDDHGGIFRSDNSFTSFEDVLSDLKQMLDNPDVFLHGTAPDRWKLDFGDKLYGRGAELQALLGAANRVASIGDDLSDDRGASSKLNKTQVVMVSGNPGAGKSRFVRSGGSELEKRGWRFLQCKFDRVVRPEPLSTLAHAFDEYIGCYTQCPKHGTDDSMSAADSECSCPERAHQLQDRIKSLISPEGLSILATHIPSLRRFLILTLPAVMPDVNERIIASLFGALLLAISSKDNPVSFFLDDLQWADPLSLSLFMTIAKETQSGSLQFTLSSTDLKEKSAVIDPDEDKYVLFVGSYRDNAIDDNQSLGETLRKLQSVDSIDMTTISLPGISIDTLNELLSDTLSMPIRRVRPLSELVIQKTGGLPLFVIEFIRKLSVDNLLTHTFTKGWEWDEDSIEIFPITESVAELYALKLRRLPKDVLLGLQIVSCFGCQVDQHVLSLLKNYDGENSVDIPTALNVALKEGLIERAAQYFSFSHDLIQKATIDSIREEDRVPLFRKLAAALIKEVHSTGSVDSVLFVVVDLINRIGSNACDCQRERIRFAELNLCAGTKAVAVPDFAGAAKFAEHGIALLSDSCWETQYELCLQLHELAVLSHFSNRTGDQIHLLNRINTVFERARNFSDMFNTHRTWTRLLSLTNSPRAIEESLRALEELGEPLDLANIDVMRVRKELETLRDRYSGESERMLAQSLVDQNKKNAMKVMSSLILYYALSKSFLGPFLSCRMIEITMKYGYCEDSIIGAVAFAASLVSSLGDIDGGSAWGHKSLSLMNICGKQSLVPSISFALYGTVFVWKAPTQSTLDYLAQGIRSSFVYGNVELAVANTYVYIARSYNTGKNIGVLKEEVEALARQHGIRFDDNNDCDSLDVPELLQLYMLPIYNILRDLQEIGQPPSSCKWSIAKNYDLMKISIEKEQFACFHSVLTNQTATEFMLRNMDSALICTNMYYDNFEARKLQMMYTCINNVFYDGLINFYFMGQTGISSYFERGENALSKMREWVRHSDWNFRNKLLLMQAEFYRITNDVKKAAVCYEASIVTARDHKFIHEEAMANELAGIFYLELGSRQRSYSYFKQSVVCYRKWGASAIASRIESLVENEFRTEVTHDGPSIGSSLCVSSISFKRQQANKS